MSSRPLAGVRVIAVGAALIGLVALAGPAVGEGAATPQWVGLGDSYASGLGTGHYYSESGDCKRSPDAYAVLDSQQVGASLTFVACSGATTSDVEADQVSSLSASTTDVSITIGGNDIGFTDVLTQCALPSWAGSCNKAINHADKIITGVLPGSLDTLYSDISAGAPSADVFVVGYPRLFNGQDCSALTFFTKKEMARLNSAADLLDTTIQGRAQAHGFTYVDPRSAFVGHAVCDSTPWLNDLTYPVEESFHPKTAGQAAFASLVAAHF